MVGVSCGPPNQGEEADEIFCKQLGELSQLLALVLTGDFQLVRCLLEIQYSGEGTEQSRRFLECVEENKFLTVTEPSREGAPLDLLSANRESLVGDVVVGDRLGHSEHEMIAFSVLREVRRVVSRTGTGCPGRLWSLLLWRYSSPAWMRCCAAALGDPAWAGGWTG